MTLLLSLLFFAGFAASAQNREAGPSRKPVAMVAGQAIYDEDLVAIVQGQILPLRRQEYEIKKGALDSLIEQRLLEGAAQKKGITPEQLLQQDVDGKVQDSTEAELQSYYLGQKDRLNRPVDEIKDQLRQTLKQ